MKKLRLRKPFRILLCIIAIIIVVTCYYPIRSIYKLVKNDYSIGASISIYKKGLYDFAKSNPHSEIIEKYIDNKDFMIENLDYYLNIDYYERDNFIETVNKLKDNKYSESDVNLINAKLSPDFIDRLTHEYLYDIIKYLNVDYFKEENYERYVAYFNGNYKKTVLYVNMDLDKEFYKDPNMIDAFSLTMLVNKYNGLKENFTVPDLVQVDEDCAGGESYLAREAKEAYERMFYAAKEEGFDIAINSSYRDLKTQQEVWDTYLKLYGLSYNEKYVTRPGFSEHQTGLGVDIRSRNNNIFKNSKEYKWMLDNSYKYGFIHRYPESKVNITGISSEAWHFRYVGVEVATYIYENNLSLEEYHAMVLDK